MEIRIGIPNIGKEIVLESTQTVAEIEEQLAQAVESGKPLRLTEASGRVVLIPANNVAYVDMSTTNSRPVGFGTVTE